MHRAIFQVEFKKFVDFFIFYYILYRKGDTMKVDKTVQNALRQAINKHGSQVALAKTCNIKPNAICRILSSQISDLSLENEVKLMPELKEFLPEGYGLNITLKTEKLELSGMCQDMVNIFEKLDWKQKAEAMQFVEDLSNKPQINENQTSAQTA